MAASLLLSISLSAPARAETDPACLTPWLPLETGNYWVYRTDSRSDTSRYITLRVLGPYEFEGKVYCQIERPGSNYLLRVDPEGRLYQRSFNSPADEMILDPKAIPEFRLDSPLGFSTQAIRLNSTITLINKSTTYARSIGLTTTSSQLQSGSSGGFLSGETLVEAFVNGKHYRLPNAGSAEIQLNLASELHNCAVPCYYVACGIGSPVDPPGSNKPCLESRIQASALPAGASLHTSITGPDGRLRYQQPFPASHSSPLFYQALPFFDQQAVGAPITLYPAGDYLITLTALDPEGKLIASTAKSFAKP